jgi:hypothetical protein
MAMMMHPMVMLKSPLRTSAFLHPTWSWVKDEDLKLFKEDWDRAESTTP